MSIEQNLSTIADALSRIATALEGTAATQDTASVENEASTDAGTSKRGRGAAKKPAAKKPAAKKPAAKKSAAKKAAAEDEDEDDSDDDDVLGSLFDDENDTPPDYTEDDVRAIAKEIIATHGKTEGRKVVEAWWSRLGVTKMSELDEGDYQKACQLGEKVLEEGPDVVY